MQEHYTSVVSRMTELVSTALIPVYEVQTQHYDPNYPSYCYYYQPQPNLPGRVGRLELKIPEFRGL